MGSAVPGSRPPEPSHDPLTVEAAERVARTLAGQVLRELLTGASRAELVIGGWCDTVRQVRQVAVDAPRPWEDPAYAEALQRFTEVHVVLQAARQALASWDEHHTPEPHP